MSITQILEELPTLTLEEREEIRQRLAEIDGERWLDGDDPLTEEEKALIEARLESHERHPETAIPWKEFKARLSRRLEQ